MSRCSLFAICRSAGKDLESLKSSNDNLRIIDGIDLTSEDAVDRVTEAVSGDGNGDGLDLVVMVAGLLTRGGIDDLDMDNVRRMMEVNAYAPLRLCQGEPKNPHHLPISIPISFITRRSIQEESTS